MANVIEFMRHVWNDLFWVGMVSSVLTVVAIVAYHFFFAPTTSRQAVIDEITNGWGDLTEGQQKALTEQLERYRRENAAKGGAHD